jgi:hypothetical protein
MPDDGAACQPTGLVRSLKDDAVKMLNARFTGFVVAGVMLAWVISALLQQLGYGATPESLGRIAELAFVTYVVKKAYQTGNGNGGKA